MPRRSHTTALLCSLGVYLTGAAAAQDRAPIAQSPITPVPAADGLPAVDRGPSPLETLTGERVAGAGRGKPRDEIETDRDSFTPATTTAGVRRLIVEAAYSFVDNRGIKETHSVPELILRYGLTDRIELRLGWNYEVGGVGNSTTGADATAEDPTAERASILREYTLAYGAKVRLTDQDRWVPQTAVILQGFTPTGGSAGTSPATQLIATGIVGWELPRRWKLDAAVRYGTASEEGDHFSVWAPSAVLRVPFGERWAAHAEYFGLSSTRRERNITKHFFSPGLHYLVTPDLEVGVRVGWGLNDQSARFFSNAGIGWRY
ncbi:MAG: transporter [Gemmataceae bacterium]